MSTLAPINELSTIEELDEEDEDQKTFDMKIYLRLCPELNNHEKFIFDFKDNNIEPDIPISININLPEDFNIDDIYEKEALNKNMSNNILKYKYNEIYPEECPQEYIYYNSIHQHCLDILDGNNSTIFLYGGKHSGKTYTLIGNKENESEGLIPRALYHLFQDIEKEKLEIGNEDDLWLPNIKISYFISKDNGFIDLLDTRNKDNLLLNEWLLLDLNFNKTKINNLKYYKINNLNDAMKLFYYGNFQRLLYEKHLKNENKNDNINYCFEIKANVSIKGNDGYTTRTEGKLNFIDFNNDNININKTNKCLINIIKSLNEKKINKDLEINYNNSLLLSYLKSSFEGNCRTIWIGSINTKLININQNINTLQFIHSCNNLSNTVSPNRELILSDQFKLLELKQKSLEKELENVYITQNTLVEAYEEKVEELNNWEIANKRTIDEGELRWCENFLDSLLKSYDNNIPKLETQSLENQLSELGRPYLLQMCRDLIKRNIQNIIKVKNANERERQAVVELNERTKKMRDENNNIKENYEYMKKELTTSQMNHIKIKTGRDIIIDEEEKKKNNNNNNNNNEKKDDNNDDNIDLDQILINGHIFSKHGKWGSPHDRYFWVNDNIDTLNYSKNENKKKPTSLSLGTFYQAIGGYMQGFKGNINNRREDRLFALLGRNKTLFLEIPESNNIENDKKLRNLFVRAFQYAIEKNN